MLLLEKNDFTIDALMTDFTMDHVLAYHCKNSIDNSDNITDVDLTFGNAVNALRCGANNVKWHLAEKEPEFGPAEMMLYNGITYIKTKTGEIYKRIKDKLFKADDKSVAFEMGDTVWSKTKKPQIIKREVERIKQITAEIETPSVADMTEGAGAGAGTVVDREHFYQACSLALADSQLLFNLVGEPKYAELVFNMNHLVTAGKAIDAIMIAGEIGMNPYSAFVHGFAFVKSVFGKKEKSISQYNVLCDLIISCFNSLANKIYELEQHMNVRFDALEKRFDTVEKNQLREYILLKDVYSQGKDIVHYMHLYHSEVKDEIRELKKTVVLNASNLKKNMCMMSDNISSFRTEKIDELISDIDYTSNAMLMTTDKIHLFLGKLQNVINNLLCNDYLTGRHISGMDTQSKIVQVRSLPFDRLLGHLYPTKKLANPVILSVVAAYTRNLIESLDERERYPVHDELLEKLAVLDRELKDSARIEIDYPALISVGDRQILTYRTQYIANRKETVHSNRRRTIASEVGLFQTSLDEVLRTDLYSYYTTISRRMKTSDYGETEAGVLIAGNSTNCCCGLYKHRYTTAAPTPAPPSDASVEPFAFIAFKNPSWQFCGSGAYGDRSHHPYGCGMHRNVASQPLYISGDVAATETSLRFLATHNDDFIQKGKIDQLVAYRETRFPNSPMRAYCNVTFRDITLKLPLMTNIRVHGLTEVLIDRIRDALNLRLCVDIQYIESGDTIREIIILSVMYENGTVVQLQTKNSVLAEVPTNHGSTVETLLNLYLGGIYAEKKDVIRFSMRTWNHDGHRHVANISYTYPTPRSHVGTFQRHVSFIGVDLTGITAEVANHESAVMRDLDLDFEYKELQDRKLLLEAEREKWSDFVRFIEDQI